MNNGMPVFQSVDGLRDDKPKNYEIVTRYKCKNKLDGGVTCSHESKEEDYCYVCEVRRK